ncbi:MAG: DUF4428 domain-containing protein [Clostridia bacterium]|nr:DUF4428 domain-containing protein [Clostridia bacterium]
MGLFGKLFEKKECSICGGEIKLLGNRKLEDGNLCKDCARKLSPWFDDRRHSTVEQIAAQLEYREANKEKVAAFCTTRTIGLDMKVLLDEDNGRFMVTDASRLAEANPDVIDFSDVTGCEFKIEDDRDELMRENADGEEESYDPPRYEHNYDFYITIHVNHPYFDEIDFQLNSSSIVLEERSGHNGATIRFGGTALNFGSGGFDPMNNQEYRQYKEMGEEIKAVFEQARAQVREEKTMAEMPKTPVRCPYCGAQTMPDENGCCEYCSSALR